MEVPKRPLISLISWTMPASTVTSRAVVGSSSSSSAGFESSAMAITTRCCWPPEIWCGKLSMIRFGSGRRTLPSISRARS